MKTSKKSIIQINRPLQLEITIHEKNIKSLILRYKDNCFYLSKPLFVSKKQAIMWLESLPKSQYEKLMKTSKIKRTDNYTYVFGRKVMQYIKDETLKQVLKDYVTMRIKELGIVDFDVEVVVRNMTAKFGCCFYTQKKVSFATRLVHEPKEVIDSVIIHELVHFYFPNHQKEFYAMVNQYDANYKKNEQFLKNGGVGDDPICE